jgi:hypothetical protein
VQCGPALDHRLDHAVALGEDGEHLLEVHAPVLGVDGLDLGPGRGPLGDATGRRAGGREDERGAERRVEQRALSGHSAPGVEEDAPGLALGRRIAVACGQARPIGERGAGADDDGLGLRPDAVRVGPGLGPGDPLRGAVGGGGASVETRRGLEEGERPTRTPLVEVGREQCVRSPGTGPRLDHDAGVPQVGDAAPGDPGVGVLDRDDDAGDAGCDQGVGAGRRAPVVGAGFEGDEGGGTACRLARGGERTDLGVVPAGSPGRALADHGAVRTDDDAPDPRIGRGDPTRARGEAQGLLHRQIVARHRHRSSRASTRGVPMGARRSSHTTASADERRERAVHDRLRCARRHPLPSGL